jgi:hypothetical protein
MQPAFATSILAISRLVPVLGVGAVVEFCEQERRTFRSIFVSTHSLIFTYITFIRKGPVVNHQKRRFVQRKKDHHEGGQIYVL